MTSFEYFRGKVGFEVSLSTIEGLLLDRGLSSVELSSMTKEQKDLIYADLLMYGSTIMSGSVKRGSFSNSINNEVAKDYIRLANSIYASYNDNKYNPSIESLLSWVEYDEHRI